MACGILIPQPGIEPQSPALAGGFLTTGHQGRPSKIIYKMKLSIHTVLLKDYNELRTTVGPWTAMIYSGGLLGPGDRELGNTPVLWPVHSEGIHLRPQSWPLRPVGLCCSVPMPALVPVLAYMCPSSGWQVSQEECNRWGSRMQAACMSTIALEHGGIGQVTSPSCTDFLRDGLLPHPPVPLCLWSELLCLEVGTLARAPQRLVSRCTPRGECASLGMGRATRKRHTQGPLSHEGPLQGPGKGFRWESWCQAAGAGKVVWDRINEALGLPPFSAPLKMGIHFCLELSVFTEIHLLCIFLSSWLFQPAHVCVCAKSLQLCPTLCDPCILAY